MMDMKQRLLNAGIRPTRARLILADLLFGKGDRHVFAEELRHEAIAAGTRVSLATIYNTLHQFCKAGLAREAAISGGRCCYDTNVSNHNHFFDETRSVLTDIMGDAIGVEGLPEPPDGMRISHVDVVVHLVAK